MWMPTHTFGLDIKVLMPCWWKADMVSTQCTVSRVESTLKPMSNQPGGR